MKRLVYAGIIGSLIFCMFILIGYAQPDKKALLKGEIETQPIIDNESYVIGPEDVLYIHVWKEDALSRPALVRLDGKITLPLVDDVQAAGLTPLQLKYQLTQKLKTFIDNPNVSVVVTEANSFKVYVSGEVKTPGIYRLRSETSLIQIIPMAGGFTEWANQKKIVIVRKENGKERRILVNYKKIVEGKDPSANVVLKPRDSVIVP